MQHEDHFDSGTSAMVVPGLAPAAQQQEALVVQMQALLSEFERNIEGSGPLVESNVVGELRREMHGICRQMREGFSRLSEQTIRLDKAVVLHQRRPGSPKQPATGQEKVRFGLRPEFWRKA